MNLNLDVDLARRMTEPGDVDAALESAKAEYRRLAALGPDDGDWPVTGWFHCAEAACQLDLIKEKAAEIRQHAEVFVLVGVGGSNQAARAMIEAIQKPGGPRIVYAGNTLSACEVARVLQAIEGKSVYIDVIAKNFETLEPGSHYRVLRAAMEKRYSKEEMAKRVIRAMEQLLAKTEGGIAAEYAAVRHALWLRGFRVEMLTAFEPRLFWAEQWWKQLFGESEGKDKKGMLPASMINSEDLHSMGQYMQDGLRILTETFLSVDDPGASVVIEPDPDFKDGFDYLDGMDFANINRAAEKATLHAHAAGGVPCVVLRLPRIDERTFGLVYYFFMVACALSGRLLGVNPFDQEGVEEYKRSMFAALGKGGVKGR